MNIFQKISLTLGALVLIALPVSVDAESVTGLSISVSPPKKEISLNPGNSYEGKVRVTNPSANPITVYPLVRNFAADSNPAVSSPRFLTDTANTPDTLGGWVTFSVTSIQLDARESKDLTYTVKVPSNAAPGGHYGAIFVSNQKDTASTSDGVTIAARVGSLLLVSVSGDIQTGGSVTSFTSDQKLYQHGPLKLTISIKNSGNIHYYPTGTITATNRLTKQKTKVTFNSEHAGILPDSTRTFSATIDPSGYGPFDISADLQGITPAGTKIPLSAVTSTWVVPLLALVIALLVVFLLLFLFKLWLSRHDKQVVSRYSRKG